MGGVAAVDIDEFRILIDDKFNDKLNSIIKAIEKLERAQERIVEIVANQAVMTTSISHIEDAIRTKIIEVDKMHDSLFARQRTIEQELMDFKSEVQKDSGNKLWDAVKIIIAGIFGGIVAWLAGHR